MKFSEMETKKTSTQSISNLKIKYLKQKELKIQLGNNLNKKRPKTES